MMSEHGARALAPEDIALVLVNAQREFHGLDALSLETLRAIKSWPPRDVAMFTARAIYAALAAADRDSNKIIAKMKAEQELFDEDARDRQALIDRIADLIGLPEDQELDQEKFKRWFNSVSPGKGEGWRERIYEFVDIVNAGERLSSRMNGKFVLDRDKVWAFLSSPTHQKIHR